MRRLLILPALFLLVACASTGREDTATPAPAQPAPTVAAATIPDARQPAPEGGGEVEDPYIWLEETEGGRAMAWVRERNEKSLAVLQGDPRYQRLHAEALEIVESTDRIAFPQFRRRDIYNFWQDSAHVQGILRRTTLDSYRTANPRWTTVLDVDSLSRAENANWVYRGADCLPPEERLCMVALSPGGKDANVLREFDMRTMRFVPNGFRLPESKGGVTWIDENTLLVGRDFGPETVTRSGYPYTTRRLARGRALENAPEIFRGKPSDVSAGVFTLRDADGSVQAVMARRGITFYESEYWLLPGNGEPVRLPFPEKMSIQALVDDQLVFTTESEWKGFDIGDLLAYDLSGLKADPDGAMPHLILRPGEREAIEGVAGTRSKLIVALYENVTGAVYVYDRKDGTWSRRKLDLPANSTVGIGSTSKLDDRLFISVSNFLQPNSLWLADAASGRVERVKATPEYFDASTHVVEQYEAASSDGTRIPYFVVRPKTMTFDGNNPTLLYGYGGYQISLLPSYSGTLGKLWLEDGGVYAVANTRGGGEFGPKWHQAALQENRQLAHDDFAAVARDLVARKITSPAKLGIRGGSQGGLFMGVAVTQHPELFNAAIIAVPLFDMLRFHKLPPGASWVAEYGDPEIPEQRAWIAEYSPYQALAPGRPYPEVFIHTSTKDDRVHPGHARKAVARLEEYGYPVLFYENTAGGHSAAANLKETAKRLALEYTYLARKLRGPVP
ncbi:MAG TPA: prolyl oligopeptidase family serine peptidase [Gemmatimonadaceae bacterium]|nr:prolyl oligopeptidase family serine peptidase [Gemmatimonadaceae bacterium]